MSEIYPSFRTINHHKKTMNNKILPNDSLLSQTHIKNCINHYFNAADAGAHVRLLLAHIQNKLNSFLPKLLVIRVSRNARHRLSKEIRESVWVLLEPGRDQLEALKTLLHDL